MRHYYRDKRPLPKYDLPRPPGPFMSGDGCIIFTLFEAYPNIVPSYVVNSAFWAAHAFRVNTNLIKKQWDICFFIENSLYPKVASQFEEAHLEDFVIRFDPLPDVVRNLSCKVGYKLYATLDPFFEQYERCFVWDPDNFVSIRDPENVLDVDRFVLGSDETLIYPTENSDRDIWLPKVTSMYANIPEMPAFKVFEEMVRDYLGDEHPLTNQHTYGMIYGWHPKKLREDFKETVRLFIRFFPEDELICGLYYQKLQEFPTPFSELWNIPIYERPRAYQRDHPHYFDHNPFYAKHEREMKELEPIWRENIGLNRRIPGE